jgi:DNA anti-recombination protein RmuC
MNSSQTPSGAERAAAAAAESAAAYQKYVVRPGVAPVKDKVHDTKETAQAKAKEVKQQAKAKAKEVQQQAKAAAEEVQQQAKAAADEARQQAQAKAEEVKHQAQSLIHQALAKLPPPVAARIEPLMATAKQRPLPTAAVTMGMLLVLRRLLRRNR